MLKIHRLWRSIASAALLALVAACSQTPQPTGPGLAGSSLMVLRNDVTGHIAVPHSAALELPFSLTIEGWVRFEVLVGECVSLVGKDFEDHYWVGWCEDAFRSFVGGDGTEFNAGTFTVGQWTHFAVTSNATTRNHYLNGVLVGSAAIPHSAGSGEAELRIGSDVSWNETPSASLDEVRLWDRALTQTQIQEVMGMKLTEPRAGLVAVWPLDFDGRDALGAHHGSLVGAPAFGLDGEVSPADSSMAVVYIETPNCDGQGVDQVRYDVIPFTVEEAGAFRVTVKSWSGDASFYVYEGSFNPANATANCVAASNSGSNGRKSVEVELSAGGPHHLVVINDSPNQNSTAVYTASLAVQ